MSQSLAERPRYGTRVINELELCFVALRRSGHHAVIEWLLCHLDGTGCFLNNCRIGRTPFVGKPEGGGPWCRKTRGEFW